MTEATRSASPSVNAEASIRAQPPPATEHDARNGARRLRILTFSTLFPNAAKPGHGIFVETRLRHLVRSARCEARVIAPVPWFPSADRRFGRYAAFARAPWFETRHGLPVFHPRFVALPKIGTHLAPWLLASAAGPAVSALIREGGSFDVIDAHYFYPDGVAAALLARRFGRPFVVTARGTDLNVIAQSPIPRRLIRWAALRADALITVSNALKDQLQSLGVPGERITVLRNGVDLAAFHPGGRSEARDRLAFGRPTLLSVGNLLVLKGHHVAIEALALLTDIDLVIVGEGPERDALAALAQRLRVDDRVRFAGALPQSSLRDYYAAADALVLASSREGWPNVLLESMACGSPVVATRAGGIPEVVAAPEAGELMAERTPQALAAAVRRLLSRSPDRAATRAYAERFSWDATTRGQLDIFERIVARRSRGEPAPGDAARPGRATTLSHR